MIFFVLAALFTLSMFYRVSSAVIAPDLVRDLNLNAESLGVIGGAFFYSFALLQIVLGVLLDRIGPRLVMTVFALIGASGAFIFAGSHSLATAFLGRVLIGIGMASALMGSLKIFVLRFSPRQFSTLAGVFVSIGTLGTLLATSPLAYLALTIGWRGTFVLAGILTGLLAFFVFWVLKESGEAEKHLLVDPSNPVNAVPLSRLVKLVLANLSFWQISAFAFFRYGTFVALQGLWFGTYLMGVGGFSAVQAGNILMTLSIGYIAGAPVAGYLSDRVFQSAKKTGLCAICLYALCLVPLTGLLEIHNPVFYPALFFVMGFFNSFGTLAYTHVKELFPLSISGTVIAWLNFFVMAGGAVLMPVLGAVIETFTAKGQSYSLQAYRLAFLICFLGMAASLVFYAFSKSGKSGR